MSIAWLLQEPSHWGVRPFISLPVLSSGVSFPKGCGEYISCRTPLLPVRKDNAVVSLEVFNFSSKTNLAILKLCKQNWKYLCVMSLARWKEEENKYVYASSLLYCLEIRTTLEPYMPSFCSLHHSMTLHFVHREYPPKNKLVWVPWAHLF